MLLDILLFEHTWTPIDIFERKCSYDFECMIVIADTRQNEVYQKFSERTTYQFLSSDMDVNYE